MLVIKFVPDRIKKYVRYCKNLLKKVFATLVICHKLGKKVKQMKINRSKKETY